MCCPPPPPTTDGRDGGHGYVPRRGPTRKSRPFGEEHREFGVIMTGITSKKQGFYPLQVLKS